MITQTPRRWAAALALAASAVTAHAHGDEPHGDAPHNTAGGPQAAPRFEAATEAFEMVGRLQDGVLTLFLQRFATSEPVPDAAIELESGEVKAEATYVPADGSYTVSAPAFVQAMARAGSHPIIATVVAGADADLLEATLEVAAAEQGPQNHRPTALAMALAGAAALMGGGVAIAWLLRKRRMNAKGSLA